MLEKICNSGDVWDRNSSWNTTSPDLTLCLQSTFLVWVPCFLLWLLLPFEVWQACHSKRRKLSWTFNSAGKLFLNSLLSILSAMKLSIVVRRYMTESYPSDIASVLGTTITCTTHVLILLVTLHRQQRGLRVSHVLPIFWLVWSIVTWSMAYSTIRDSKFWLNADVQNGGIDYVVEICIAIVATLQLILSGFAEPSKINTFVRLGEEGEEDSCQMTSNSLYSFIFFMWMNKVMYRGVRGLLEPRDLPDICSDLKCNKITNAYECAFQKRTVLQGPKTKVPLAILLWCTCWKPFVFGCCFEMLNIVADYLPPFMLQQLLNFVQSDEPTWHGYLYGTLFCLGSLVSSLAYNMCDYSFSVAGWNIKTALSSALYKKILKLSPASRQEFPAGEILNMMSTDVVQVYSMVQVFSTMWGAPIRISLTILYLWQYLGASSLASLVVMGILLPCSFFQGRIVEKLQIKVMASRDERIKRINELINGIKILKMYAWEKPFMKRILDARLKEIDSLRKSCYLDSFFVFLWVAAPLLVCVACFGSYVVSGHVLDASTAFVSLTLFNILRFPMGMIAHVYVQVITSIVSVRRLEKFLYCEDFECDAVGANTDEGHAIVFKDASLSWTRESGSSALKDINLHVPKGSLVAVVGTVGCGKSSLFSAMIGDMYKTSGNVDIKGSVAYVPQQAWIQNATVQRNITFVKPYMEQKYNKLLDACALRPDLEVLSGGDQTEIGEKGINLSGGQKQRVSLARAAYQDADIYLFDDPLSAVDANVAAHIFKELIGPSGYLKKKTRVFATHNISFLPEADHIILMADGRILEEGSFSDLMSTQGQLAELMQEHASNVQAPEEVKEQIALDRRMSRQMSVLSKTSTDAEVPVFSPLTSDEEMETGRVTWVVYKTYIMKISIYIFLLIVFFNVTCGATDVGSGVWLSKWTDGGVHMSSPMEGLGIYCAFVVVQAVFVYLSYIVLFYGTMKAATKLHEELLYSVVRAPLSFFDTTPTGRIINRFSNDIETLDIYIPWNLGTFVNELCWLPAIMIVVISSSVYLLILIVPMMIFYAFVLRAYVVTSNQLQRFQSVSNSPVMSSFTETIHGYASIRAYKVQNEFVQVCHNRVNENNKCAFFSTASTRWFDAILSIITSVITIFVCFIVVWERHDFGQGLLGLVLTYCVSLSQGLNWLVKTGAALETSIVAVERIQEYSSLTPEGEWENLDTKPHNLWPSGGEITFTDYSTCYREGLDPVLKDINLKIHTGTKVGIAGRTGAGKSSLILSLFRIIEPTTGTITIDGIDVTKIGVHDLRSKLTVIPQDPVLFGVSLRKNLDPFDENTDDEIWDSLELSHLKDFVTSLAEGLDHQISEGGDNISAGQRQLVCLARALLRKSKVLIMDEATASVDLDTDQLIQKTVTEVFADCTVVTIAHRIKTIMGYDQILVFSDGKVVENDTPENLLKDTSSVFYAMAKESGVVQ